MTIFQKRGNEIFSPVDSAGNPRQPVLQDAQVWTTAVEHIIDAFLSSGGLIYTTQASLFVDLGPKANSMAWVLGDPIAANNGIYRKLGAPGGGSWVRVSDLPYSYIKATNAGAGAPNAIAATTPVPIPTADGGALIVLPIAATNTAAPATVSFNAGSVLTIVGVGGEAVSAGDLVAGMVVSGYKVGSTFRLITDTSSAANKAAAEAAQAAAQAAQAAAQAAQAAAEGAAETKVVARFNSRAGIEAATINAAVQSILLTGYFAAGDGGGALYKRVASEPAHAGKIQSADGAWWELAENVIHARMLGIFTDTGADVAHKVNELFAMANGKTVVLPGGEYAVAATVKIGNGSDTKRSTINSPTIICEGDAASAVAFINPYSGIPQSGVRFKWIGPAGGTVISVEGPINGVRIQGALQIDGQSTADYGIRYISANAGYCETLAVYNCRVRNIDLDVRHVLEVEGDANGVGCAGNIFEKVYAFSPAIANSVCLSLDGYRVEGGQDSTHNVIHFLTYGLCGNGGTGLRLGYCDFNRIGVLVGICYGTVQNNAAGVRLVGGTPPPPLWPNVSPHLNWIEQAAVGHGVSVVATGTVGDNFIFDYSLEDAALPPFGVSGISGTIRSRLNHPELDGLTFGQFQKSKVMVGDGDGYYGRGLNGAYVFSLTRQINNSHLAAVGDIEFEPGVTGPTNSSTYAFGTEGVKKLGSLTGVKPDAPAIKHKRVATDTVNATSSKDITITWDTPFANANYTATVTVESPGAALAVLSTFSKTGAGIQVRVKNDFGTPQTGTLNAIALHD